MKHLLIIFSLLAFITPAHSSQIDGKGLICDPTNGLDRQKVFLFKSGKALRYSSSKKIISVLRNKPEFYLQILEEPYSIYTHKITWGVGAYYGEGSYRGMPEYFLNRKNLQLKWLSGQTSWEFQCRISNEQEINRVMERKVRRDNQYMKKNKI